MVEIKNLDFSYSKRLPILNDLNLDLVPGNIYGLLGKNGAGKSTLLKNIAGLLFPKKGEVSVLGFNAPDRIPQFLQEIYFIPEEFELPSFTISKYADIYSAFYPKFDLQQFDQIMEEFKLDQSRKLTALSYGQKKKVIIGFGLATNCSLLLMDEPTNGLDIPSKSQFRKIVASSISEDRCFIISTHQVKDVENLIDPLIIMDEGEIIFLQTMEAITNKLAFEVKKELTDEDQIVFYQSNLGGYQIVRENNAGVDSHIDLEILFNSITSNIEKINQVFK